MSSASDTIVSLVYVDMMQAMQERTYLFQTDEFLRYILHIYTNNAKHESQCLMESVVRKITLN